MIRKNSTILNSPYETFFSKLRINIALKKDFSDSQSLINGGLTSIEALSNLKLKQPPATGQENYQYLTSVWQQGNMRTFTDFFRWYSNKDFFRTLESMQKMVEFYQSKGTDMLKLGCSLPNLAKTCVLKSQLL